MTLDAFSFTGINDEAAVSVGQDQTVYVQVELPSHSLQNKSMAANARIRVGNDRDRR